MLVDPRVEIYEKVDAPRVAALARVVDDPDERDFAQRLVRRKLENDWGVLLERGLVVAFDAIDA